MKKILIIFAVTLLAQNALAQIADEFFAKMPKQLPSVSDLVNSNYAEEPLRQSAIKRLDAFEKQVDKAMGMIEEQGIRNLVESVKSPVSYGNLNDNPVIKAQLDSLLVTIEKQPIEPMPIDTTYVAPEINVAVLSSHAADASIQLHDTFGENGWSDDETADRWFDEYKARQDEIAMVEADLLDLIAEFDEKWYSDYSQKVSDLNAKISENQYQWDECGIMLEDTDKEDPHPHEKIDDELNKSRRANFSKWATQQAEAALPLCSKLLGLIKASVPYAVGMDRFLKQSDQYTNSANELVTLQKYALVMKDALMLGNRGE